MAESIIFEWVSSELEKRTSLSRLEARGTVRLVLKHAGLDPHSVSAHQMQVVVERLLSGALGKRRVEDADHLCRALGVDLRAFAQQSPELPADTAYDVFERLDSDSTRRPKQ